MNLICSILYSNCLKKYGTDSGNTVGTNICWLKEWKNNEMKWMKNNENALNKKKMKA